MIWLANPAVGQDVEPRTLRDAHGFVVEAKRPPKQHSDDSLMCEKKKLPNASLRSLSSIRTTGLSHE